jgi:hypothetical protein
MASIPKTMKISSNQSLQLTPTSVGVAELLRWMTAQ